MAGESVGIETPLVDGLAQAETWLTNNSDLFIQYGVNIISAIIILFIGNMIVKAVANSVAKVLESKQMDKAVVQFIHGLVRYLLFVIVLIAALGRLGVQTASVVAVIGAAGLAIGLALQGSLSNFAAGVLIVAFRPFKSGDYVEVGGVAGSVEAIQIFQTVLKTPDNKMVVVPKLIGNWRTNYQLLSSRNTPCGYGNWCFLQIGSEENQTGAARNLGKRSAYFERSRYHYWGTHAGRLFC